MEIEMFIFKTFLVEMEIYPDISIEMFIFKEKEIESEII